MNYELNPEVIKVNYNYGFIKYEKSSWSIVAFISICEYGFGWWMPGIFRKSLERFCLDEGL